MPINIEKDNSISISGFEGIGQSPISEFSDMLGVNSEIPGVAGVNFKFNKISEEISATTFTAVAGTDFVVAASSLWYRGSVKGLAVTVSSTGTLPTGLAADTIYYVVNVTTSTVNYRLATTLANAEAGTYINIEDEGTGTHTITPITPGKIVDWTENPSGDLFFIANTRSDDVSYVWFMDSIGSVPYLLAGRSTTIASGIVYYKGYVLVFHSNGIDALTNIQDYNSALTWNNNFDGVTISTGTDAMPFLSVNDGAIYFYTGEVTGRYYQIGLLEEVAGETFNPATGTTFSCVIDALTIPFECYQSTPVDIDEISEYLVVASGTDKLYFWDKKSPSFTYFIKLQESGIKGIEIVSNEAYVFMKNSGNIYQANTSSSGLFLSVPDHLTNELYNFIPGADNYTTNYTFVYKRELLFSISILDTTTTKNYVMAYNFDRQQLVKKYISSYGETSERIGGDYGRIHSIYNQGDNLLLSSSDYTITGDVLNYALESQWYGSTTETTRTKYVYNNYEPYIITGLVSVGDIYSKQTLKELRVSFLRELATGQGVKVYYRRNDNGAWTLLKTINHTTNGAIKDLKTEAPITDVIDLQIKIELAGSNLTTPYLKLVRLIP